MQHHAQPRATQVAIASRPIIAAAAAVAALAAAVLLLHPAATHAAPAKPAVVSTRTTTLGRVLVDARGRTLYLFQKDRHGKSACAGQCATFWPPVTTTGKPRVTGGAKATLIGTVRRGDGRLQVTYNHHPLYSFVKDTKSGQTNGEGFNAFGARWYAISTSGMKVEKSNSSNSGG